MRIEKFDDIVMNFIEYSFINFFWIMFLKRDLRMTQNSLKQFQTKRHKNMSLEKLKNLMKRRILSWLLFLKLY